MWKKIVQVCGKKFFPHTWTIFLTVGQIFKHLDKFLNTFKRGLVIELLLKKRLGQIFCPWKKPEQFGKFHNVMCDPSTYTRTDTWEGWNINRDVVILSIISFNFESISVRFGINFVSHAKISFCVLKPCHLHKYIPT